MNSLKSNSLQWKIAVSTFISIMLASLSAILLLSYLLHPYLSLSKADLINYLIVISIGLVFVALLFALRSSKGLTQLVQSLEHITLALPLLSSKKYDEAKLAFSLADKKSQHKEITQLQFSVFQLTSLLEKLDANVHNLFMLKKVNLKVSEILLKTY